ESSAAACRLPSAGSPHSGTSARILRTASREQLPRAGHWKARTSGGVGMEHGRLRIPVAVATLVLFALAEPVSAASQGALGASSRGSVTITVSVRAPARIAGLGDFRIDGSSSAQNICFRGAAHRYTLAAQGSGPGGPLSLSN